MKRELMKKGLKELEIPFTEKQLDRFALYSALLTEWNKKMNLTAVTDAEGITLKHFLDSLLVLRAVDFKEGASFIDVGTGAGFPGMPMKIMREDLSALFLDSLQKRIGFLKEAGAAIGVENAEYAALRAEDAGKKKEYREKFDFAVSRAVADLEILCEYCLPFVKTGGIFIALKSYGKEEELQRARAMIGNLGGVIREVKNLPLPQTDIIRSFILVEKVRSTPAPFPRTAAKIKRKKAEKDTGVIK